MDITYTRHFIRNISFEIAVTAIERDDLSQYTGHMLAGGGYLGLQCFV